MNTLDSAKMEINSKRFFIGREEIAITEPMTLAKVKKLFERFLPSVERYGIDPQPLVVNSNGMYFDIGHDCRIEFTYSAYGGQLCPAIYLATPSDLELRKTKLPLYRALDQFVKDEVAPKKIGKKLKRFFRL